MHGKRSTTTGVTRAESGNAGMTGRATMAGDDEPPAAQRVEALAFCCERVKDAWFISKCLQGVLDCSHRLQEPCRTASPAQETMHMVCRVPNAQS